MLAKKLKDIKIRSRFVDHELKNNLIKFVYTNFYNLNKTEPKFGSFSTKKLKNVTKTKVVRRCIFSNRNRGNLRLFNISRIKFKELFHHGILPGYQKSA